MRNYLFYFLLFAFTQFYAQVNNGLDGQNFGGSLIIEPEIDNPVEFKPDPNVIIPEAPIPLPPIKKDDSPKPMIDKQYTFGGNDGLLDAGTELQKKWDAKEKAAFKGNQKDQFLGSFNIEGTFFSVECRDYAYVDGDRVQIYVNGVLIEPNFLLVSNYRGINADLKKGRNLIEFVALNQGTSGPNTARFRVLDASGSVVTVQEWNLLTGVKASLVVNKI